MFFIKSLIPFSVLFVLYGFSFFRAEAQQDDSWRILKEPGPVFVTGCKGSQWSDEGFMIMVSSSDHLRLFVVKSGDANIPQETQQSGNINGKEELIPEFVGSLSFLESSPTKGAELWVGGNWVLYMLKFLRDQTFTFLENAERTPEFVLHLAENLECPKDMPLEYYSPEIQEYMEKK